MPLAMPFRAETIVGYIQGVHMDYLVALARKTDGSTPTLTSADLEVRSQSSPDSRASMRWVPSVPAMLLVLIPAILLAVSVVKEKELGSTTIFYVTPTTRIEFLIGKQLPCIVIAMVNFALLTWTGVNVFGVPMKGSLAMLTLGVLFYLSVTTGLGLAPRTCLCCSRCCCCSR